MERIERHRNALLRFIETIPHAEDCNSRGSSDEFKPFFCNCYLSRIPKSQTIL